MIKRFALPVAAASLLAGIALQADANPGVTYNDAVNDVAGGIYNPNGILDIVKMEVSNTATDITFSLTTAANPITNPDWGKYMIGIANGKGSGTSSSDGWARPIYMSANGGMTHWIGSWVDSGGGAELRSNATGWGLVGATYSSNFGGFSISGNTVNFTVSLASLGLSVGDTFRFDAYTSGGGGGDGAIDALANNNASVQNWGDSYTSDQANTFSYTVGAVPAPGAIALMGLAGLVARRRKA